MKLIKFEKENCSSCNAVENFLNVNNIEHDKVNPFEYPELAVKYDIGSVPVTILLDDNGNEVKRSIGFKPNELEDIINELN